MKKHDVVSMRPARLQYWPRVRDLLQSNALPLGGAEAHLADFQVAEKDGAVCGCAGLECDGEFALLRSCAVDNHHHGQGVGSELVRRAISSAQARGITQIVLLTTTAERFFPKFGFETIARGCAGSAQGHRRI